MTFDIDFVDCAGLRHGWPVVIDLRQSEVDHVVAAAIVVPSSRATLSYNLFLTN